MTIGEDHRFSHQAERDLLIIAGVSLALFLALFMAVAWFALS